MSETELRNQDALQEFRQQKHEFILHYYDMATKDLDRHLKIGWQTIVVLGTSIATLSLGFKGDLPIPVAMIINLLLLAWCANNIIDANFWSLRAIAFLANVEAVYFRKDERKCFNMYAGEHPPWHMMESLGNLARLILILACLTLTCYGYYAFDPNFAGARGIRDTNPAAGVANRPLTGGEPPCGTPAHSRVEMQRAHDTNNTSLLPITSGISSWVLWTLLLFVATFCFWWTSGGYHRAQQRYLDFIKNSPGPGMVTDVNVLRPVDLRDSLPPTQVESGENIQAYSRHKLSKMLRTSKCLHSVSGVVAALALASFIAALILGSTVGR